MLPRGLCRSLGNRIANLQMHTITKCCQLIVIPPTFGVNTNLANLGVTLLQGIEKCWIEQQFALLSHLRLNPLPECLQRSSLIRGKYFDSAFLSCARRGSVVGTRNTSK